MNPRKKEPYELAFIVGALFLVFIKWLVGLFLKH